MNAKEIQKYLNEIRQDDVAMELQGHHDEDAAYSRLYETMKDRPWARQYVSLPIISVWRPSDICRSQRFKNHLKNWIRRTSFPFPLGYTASV